MPDDLWYLKDKVDGKRVPSKRHGRGKRWRVRYFDDQGKERSPLFARQGDAIAFEATVLTDVARGAYIDPAAGKLTFATHAAAWLAGQTFGESTRETVESRLSTRLLPALGQHELRALKPSTIQAFMRGMQADGHAASYTRRVMSVLTAILAAAVDDGLIAKNPCRAGSVSPPKTTARKVVPWDAGRVFAVGQAMRDEYEASVYCGYGLGLRQGEILGLGGEDIDWLGRVVHVRRQIRIVRNTLVFAPPKGGKERDVPLSSETSLRLAAHIAAHPPVKVTLPWLVPDGRPSTAALLFTRAGQAVPRAWFNMCVWNPALTAAGVALRRKGTPHTNEHGMHVLRHTFASSLLANGVDVRALAEYLGHSDPGFTLRTYTHLMPSAESKARAAIDAAFLICAGSVPTDHDRRPAAGQTA